MSFRRALPVLLVAFWTALGAHAATFVVDNTGGDAGPGTLRKALADTFDTVEPDTIIFNIPGSGPHSISPSAFLPFGIKDVTIDGTTQPGYAGTPIIEIDGGRNWLFGFRLDSGNTLRGILVHSYPSIAVSLEGSDNLIESCWFLSNRDGTPTSAPTAVHVSVGANSHRNRIGRPGAGNVISGAGAGIDLSGGANIIQGNFLGVNFDGSGPLANAVSVQFNQGASAQIGGSAPGQGNVIHASGNCIRIQGDNTSATIQGNHIGTNAAGTDSISGNKVMGTPSGITCLNKANLFIGGSAPGEGNLIGSIRIGIAIYQCNFALIQGNKIGTNVTADATLPTGWGLILYGFGSITRNILLGGPQPGAGNVISGNIHASVYIAGSGASQMVIQGNKFGVAGDGVTPLVNGDEAIAVHNGAHDIIIGGERPGEGNIIGNHPTEGIALRIEENLPELIPPQRIVISGNSIYNSTNYNIDIERDDSDKRRSLNDPGDGDTGPNGRQNYPDLLPALEINGDLARIQGTLDSAPSGIYRIQFFASPDRGTNNQAQARTFLGAVNAITNSQGLASFSFVFPKTYAGQYLAATATDSQGNTSELSFPVLLVNTSNAVVHEAWTAYGSD